MVYLVHRHKLFCRIGLVFTQRDELDVLRGSSLVSERRLERIQVMSSNCHQLPPSTDILVQLVLQVYDRRVRSLGELDIAQNSACKVRPDFFSLGRCKFGKRTSWADEPPD